MHVWTLILVFHQDMNHRKEIYDILQPGFISTYKKKPLSIILLLNKCKKKLYCCFAIFRYPYRNGPVLSYGQCRHGNILITDHTNMTLQITNFFYPSFIKIYSKSIVLWMYVCICFKNDSTCDLLNFKTEELIDLRQMDYHYWSSLYLPKCTHHIIYIYHNHYYISKIS